MADTDPDDRSDSDSGADEVHDYEDKSDTDVYVDRDKIDFDPDDGLLSGTAIKGGTDIPGPHENVDDVVPDESDGADGDDSEDDPTDELERDEADADADDDTDDEESADERDSR